MASLGAAIGSFTLYLTGAGLTGAGVYGFTIFGVWAERKRAMLSAWQENPMPGTFRSMARTFPPTMAFAILVYGIGAAAPSSFDVVFIAEIVATSLGAGLLFAFTFTRIAKISEREDYQLRRLVGIPFEEVATRIQITANVAGMPREPSKSTRRHTTWTPIGIAGLKGEVKLVSWRERGTFVFVRKSEDPESLAQRIDAARG